MKALHWSTRLVLWMQILLLSTSAQQNQDVFVSQRTGRDILSCGIVSSPCKTIAMGISLTKPHAQVHVDGTGSETKPYSCKSSSLKLPGIYSNKSVLVIGVQSIVYIKCQQGSGIRFDKSDQNETIVSLTNIKFIGTFIQAKDVSLDINDCIFTDSQQAFNIVQSTKPLTISFTNSLCMNTSSCISVNITNRVIPTNNVTINVTNSNVVRSWWRDISMGQASGIHVMSTGEYDQVEISCLITLKNVTFRHNHLGRNGFILMALKNAFTSMKLDNVLFLENQVKVNMTSLISIQGSYNHHMILHNAEFHHNYQGICCAISMKTENEITLSISDSWFDKFSVGYNSGVLYLNSDKGCKVTMENTTCTDTNGLSGGVGGCLSLNSQTATVDIKDSLFSNNQAECAAVLWLNVEDHIVATINGSHFESNMVLGPGGLASIDSREINVEMTDSTIDHSIAHGSGGMFDIGNTGCGKSKVVYNASLVMRGVGSMNGAAGLVVMKANTANILIQDSIIYNVSSSILDGVICVNYNNGLQSDSDEGHDIKLINTTFSKIQKTNLNGVVVYSDLVKNVELESVKIDFVQTGIAGSIFCLISRLSSSISINNTVIKHYSGLGADLLILITGKLGMTITNSVFESSRAMVTSRSGGCLSISTVSANILLRNVTFKNCYSMLGDHGGAIYLTIVRGNISIESCKFIRNGAPKGSGGAIAFDLFNKDTIINPGCRSSCHHSIRKSCIKESDPYRTWRYNTSTMIKDSIFINNTALSGGALYLSRGSHTIQNCLFIDNFAKYKGGHIFVTSDSTSLKILDSTIVQNHSMIVVPPLDDKETAVKYGLGFGMLISSQGLGPLVIVNSTLESRTPNDGESKTLVSISNKNHINFGDQTFITCPRGSKLDILNITSQINSDYKSQTCMITVITLQFTCNSCPIDTYSLQHGQSMGVTKVSGFQCLPCPFGAECHTHILARPNFWGYEVKKNPTELNFTICPLGYCKQPDQQDFIDYNSCYGNRNGTLCGQCKENYTETLLSPFCRDDNHCHDNWLWGVVIVMIMFMALYLICKPQLSHKLSRQILWFRSHKDNNGEGRGGVGYLKIVFYFYQVAHLLLVTSSFNTILESYLLQPVVGIFNFQFRVSSDGILCPFPRLTSVTKQLLFASQVFGVLFMIAMSYCCHCLLHKCRSRPPPNMGPYLGAVLETLLLGYAVFANTSLQLLQCTSIGDESRLFISGDVVCYQWWQYVPMVFVGVFVFPFILILALGSRWLHDDTVSIKEFLLGCVLPLPYLVYKLILYLRGPHNPRHEAPQNPQQEPQQELQQEPQHQPQHQPQHELQHQPQHEPAEWKASVTNVLYGPFRDGISGAVYWESILISRRLVVILIYVFVSDPLLKELLLVLACVVILSHHIIIRPFHTTAANNTETVSLFTLVVIATINSFKASFLSIGQAPKGPLLSIVGVFDWVQTCILVAPPIVCILAVPAAIVSLIIRLVVRTYITRIPSRDYQVIAGDVSESLLEPCQNDD